jgi:Flp pilus assembly pilin Flp
MPEWVADFCRGEDGQDLIEYSLLIAFMALACAALFGGGRPATSAIWSHVDNELTSATQAATGN